MAWQAAAATVGASLLSQVQQGFLRKEQREYDQRLLRETSAYNSPASQIARYRAAGLNPSLLLQNPDPGNTSPIQGEVQSVPDFGSVFNQAIQSSLVDAQRDVLESQAQKNEAEAGVASQTSKQMQETLPKLIQSLGLQVDKLKAEIEHMQANTAYLISLTEGQANLNTQTFWQAKESSLSYFERYARFKKVNEFIDAELNSMWSSSFSSKGFGEYMKSMAELNFRSMNSLIAQRYWTARDAQMLTSLHYHQAANEGLTFENRNMPLNAIPVTHSQRQMRYQTLLMREQIQNYPVDRWVKVKSYLLEAKKLNWDIDKSLMQFDIETARLMSDNIIREQGLMLNMFQTLSPFMTNGSPYGSTSTMTFHF